MLIKQHTCSIVINNKVNSLEKWWILPTRLTHLSFDGLLVLIIFTFYLIETPFNTFASRADSDQAALVRAAWSGSTLFAYGNMMYPILH